MKIASLEKVAKEMNKVMCYGLNDKGEVEDESELIDLELSDKALAKEIAKRAKEDLAPNDKDEFSEDVWAYFAKHGLLPEGCEANSEEEDEEEDEPKPKSKKEKSKKVAKEEPEEEEEPEEPEEEAPKAKKEKSKKEKSEPKGGKEKQAKEKKATRDKGPSFEQIACDIVKSTKPNNCREALMEKFTELYHARGKTDEDFIRERVEIYYRIAAKRLGMEYEPVGKKEKTKKTAPAKSKKAGPDPDGMDEDEEEEEAPKPKKSKK